MTTPMQAVVHLWTADLCPWASQWKSNDSV